MSSQFEQLLQALQAPDSLALARGIQRGIEKESLRITPDGKLSQAPHPAGLGSPLTHRSITTDYSEALLEFITPVSVDIEESLQTLENIHRFVYREIGEEILWAASMPCIVAGDQGIPVARYGSSNVARMKTVYRYGLGHRYGRTMQAIAGVHYNFSMPFAYWEKTWREASQPGKLKDYISQRYLLNGIWENGKLGGTWQRQDEPGQGTWKAVRPDTIFKVMEEGFRQVPLYEWRHLETGTVRYDVDRATSTSVWKRIEPPLGQVWIPGTP